MQGKTLILVCLINLTGISGMAADLHVDPELGSDGYDGVQQPTRTIARAIRMARPGDTIHLQPKVYRDWAAFNDIRGEVDRPIVLDGHGATLEGCDPLAFEQWQEVSPGLFRHTDLLPLTDAIISRWFLLWDGKMNRMRRCSKGPSEPLKSPESLQPREWTFVLDESRPARPGYIHGSFYLRLPAGQKLAEAKIEAPIRPAGVSMHGKCAHLIVRNLTSTHPYNDGFNLSDCQDIRFENIRSIECGDDGISAHGDSRYEVNGYVSIQNTTGICDTGRSQTKYQRVFIRDTIGFDLFFLDTGSYTIHDGVILSSAVRPLYLQGRDKPAPPCIVNLQNVLLQRDVADGEIRVSANCRLNAVRTTFLNLDLQATGGDVEMTDTVLGGRVSIQHKSTGASGAPVVTTTLKTIQRPPEILLWKDATWRGTRNLYDLTSWRIDKTTFRATQFGDLQKLLNWDSDSVWVSPDSKVNSLTPVGADVTALRERVVPSDQRSAFPATPPSLDNSLDK